MQSSSIRLILCDINILECVLQGDHKIATYLNINVAESWSEFGTSIFQFVLEKVNSTPKSTKWWAYLPIHIESNTLIGSCGFKGPPNNKGEVELGYEVAKGFRNQGYATEIAKLLIAKAVQNSKVKLILAHTLAEQNASVKVLQKCGFKFIEEINDPEDGIIWKWKLDKKR